MNYKSGDSFQHAVCGRSNQSTFFIDSTGRIYALSAHTLPSARSLGEPLASRFKGQDGANYIGCMMGAEDDLYLMATSAGYGFVARLGDLHTRNKAGKSALTVSDNAEVLPPEHVPSQQGHYCFIVTLSGYLAGYAAEDLPQMGRGKGVKMAGISGPDFKNGKDAMLTAVIVPEGGQLKIYSGKRHIGLKWSELKDYLVERGKKGQKLPRGFQKVAAVEVVG